MHALLLSVLIVVCALVVVTLVTDRRTAARFQAAVQADLARPALLHLAWHDLPAALRQVDELLAKGPPAPLAANDFVNIRISAGRYRSALELGEPGRVLDLPGDNQHLLIQVNLAEAEYNLGRWEAAEARIRGALAACEPFDLTRGGARIQLAWILANTGRSEEAIRLCETVELEWFPDIYRAEPCFTSALALLGLGRLDEAQTDAECGRDLSMRPSSERNAQFILARVARARGDLVTAEALCREAAGREYRGQGGDGLLLWGDLLSELDRAGEARAAWALAVERDPESESAAHAARRLASASEA